ncbi:MAG: 16S rRNA (adenine(1518)-N(6)/adenine(1519)-N(6))-dimethyltransferase RsmA [Pirellulales bacterium]|nr:16S rRNA (adenine(1518)-N(6)/adenine(1519)-N(6))-dimethyltransferase RsmA [Pirellulales bacterium]
MNLQQLIASTAQLTRDDVVLEIGTGTGALTALMAPDAAHVVTVEIDERMYQLASEELVDVDNVTQLQMDALRNKNNFRSELLGVLEQRLTETPGRRLKLVANLPYNVATPIISNLLRTRVVPHSMVVTIQKELGERIAATPSTKDYSALSVWIQAQCDARIVRIMPPSVFWPRPKVQSAIVEIVVDHERRDHIADREFFHSFTRSLFMHRRKFLRSVLLAAFKKQLGKTQIDEVMHEMQLGPTARAEELSVPMILTMSDLIQARLDTHAD